MQQKTWIAIVLLMVCWIPGIAEELPSQPSMISGLVSDSTLVVIRIRTDQINLEQSWESLQNFWQQLYDVGQQNEEVSSLITASFTKLFPQGDNVQEICANYRIFSEEAKSLFGTDEFFLFMDQNHLFMYPLMIGIRPNSQIDAAFEQPEFHEKLLQIGWGFLLRKMDNWYILIPLSKESTLSSIVEKSLFSMIHGGQQVSSSYKDEETLLQERRNLRGDMAKVCDETLRDRRILNDSAFEEAFDFLNDSQGAPNAAMQFVCVVPDHAKRIFSQIQPTLSGSLSSIQIATLLKPRWIAIAIDTNTPELFYAIRTENENEMKEFYSALCDIRKYAIEVSFQPVAATIYLRLRDSNLSFVSPLKFLNSEELSQEDKEEWQKFQDAWNPLLMAMFDRVIPEPVGNQMVTRINPMNTLANIRPEFAQWIQVNLQVSATNFLSNLTTHECLEHLKWIALAFHNYHDSKGQFPPPYSVDENGKPLHSWRVLILPYLVYGDRNWHELSQQIRLDEPWDSEWNRQFHDQMPDVYRCIASVSNESDDQTLQTTMKSMTPYCLIVGPDAYLPLPDKMGLYQITDGSSNTVLVIERRKPICWMEPVDLSQDVAFQGVEADNGIGSTHPRGFNAAFADGSNRFIPADISQTLLHAIITIAGGEVFSMD